MGSKSARWLLALSVVVILFLTGGRANAAGPTDFLAMAPSSDYAFAYLDVAKIRNSKLFTELKPALLDGPASAGLSAIQLMTGVHLLNDIDAVAVSGKVGPPPGLCAYFTGRWDAERLKNLLALNPSYTEATRTAHTIISFTDQRRGSTISLCFLKKDLAVAGSKEAVEAVVDLAAGKGASMAASDRVRGLLTEIGANPVAMVFVVRPPDLVLPSVVANQPGVKNLTAALVALFESPTTLEAVARANADSAEMAGLWLDVAKGAIALGRIQDKAPKLAEIASRASASRRDMGVEVRIQTSASEASNLLRQITSGNRLPVPRVGRMQPGAPRP